MHRPPMSTPLPETPIRLRVSYRTPESLIGEFTRSVGVGNVALESRRKVPVGTRFVFELHAQGVTTPVEVLGEVTQVTQSAPDRFLLSIKYRTPGENRAGLDAMLERIFDAHRYEKLRKFPRIPIHLRATSDTPYSPSFLVRDVSRGGIGVEVEAPQPPRMLKVGAPFLLELHVSLGVLNLHGEVAWVYRGMATDPAAPQPKFGVVFGKLRPETLERLDQILSLKTLPPPPWKARLSLGMEAVSRMP